jgi:hypothetical protein
MTHGFDLQSPLVCEGIIGDGCGGGRLFVVEGGVLFAYDPYTQTKITLLEGLNGVDKVSKSGCIITLNTQEGVREFDLSSLH